MTVIVGDCVEAMAALPAESVHAIVTDPPYGLEFMGKSWDRLDGAALVDDPASVGGFQDPSGGGNAYSKSRVRYGKRPGPEMQAWHERWAREAMRVLKPGGHLLAFSGTRTYHRLACAVEDAGFEIRDMASWMYGSGFPKSSRVNQSPMFCQCDEAAHSDESTARALRGDDRICTAETSSCDVFRPVDERCLKSRVEDCLDDCQKDHGSGGERLHHQEVVDRSCFPSQEYAQEHTRSGESDDVQGSGPIDNLSPARCKSPHASKDCLPRIEASDERQDTHCDHTSPVDMSGMDVRKPGSLGSSSCVDYASAFPRCQHCGKLDVSGWGTALKPSQEPIVLARKPLCGTVAANVQEHGTGAINIDAGRVEHDGSGVWGDHGQKPENHLVDPGGDGVTMEGGPWNNPGSSRNPKGRWPANVILDAEAGALLNEQAPTERPSRFYYCPKPTRDERDRGLERFARVPGGEVTGREPGSAGATEGDKYAGTTESERANIHPTVKPIDLMRYLISLVTPPGGTVLDPFLGSGTTGCAAAIAGVEFIGIEREAEYAAIAEARIEYWTRKAKSAETGVDPEEEDAGQLGLF